MRNLLVWSGAVLTGLVVGFAGWGSRIPGGWLFGVVAAVGLAALPAARAHHRTMAAARSALVLASVLMITLPMVALAAISADAERWAWIIRQPGPCSEMNLGRGLIGALAYAGVLGLALGTVVAGTAGEDRTPVGLIAAIGIVGCALVAAVILALPLSNVAALLGCL